jgi:hypothetical protein
MNHSPRQFALLLILLALACFALSQLANAQCPQVCNDSNTGLGINALINNTTGAGNTATGSIALTMNTNGNDNTATGAFTLTSNTSGGGNTATGGDALNGNTTGNFNTASGGSALILNTTGSFNMASGYQALYLNTTGNHNTAIGFDALEKNTTGSRNISMGSAAGRNLTTGDDNIHIGNQGLPRDSNVIRIGTVGTQTATFLAGINGATVPTGIPVIVDTAGHLGTTTSSARYKDNVQPMNEASEAILALKPVTFRYKHDLDPKGIPQFGLVAEDVEKVNPDLVARDEQGKPYTVRYDAVNAMLLNEFLKARRQIDAQQKQIDALAAGLQKVSAQLELSKATPQTVLNDQ